MQEIGIVHSFDEKKYIEIAQMLVDADEPERAIKLLTDCLPAYYRDNIPENINAVKKMILHACMTPPAYMECTEDSVFCEDGRRAKQIMDGTLRGSLLEKSVRLHNENNKTPHIIDMGSGELWLPMGLKEHKLRFTYQDIIINSYTKEKSKHIQRHEYNGTQYTIFCALEVIEHLSNVNDMNIEMLRHTAGHGANEIHLSTPLYVYDPRHKPIDALAKNGLPHLRGYTPKEFFDDAQAVFGADYKWEFHANQIMSLVGILK